MDQEQPERRSGGAWVTVAVAAGCLLALRCLYGLVRQALGEGGTPILWMLIVPVGVVVLGALHYIVWGRAMMEQTAAEREAARREQEQEL